MVLTASAKSIKKTDQLVKTLEQAVDGETQEKPLNCQVEAVGLERVEQAREWGTTPGKLNLVEKLQQSAQDPDDIDVEDWLDCSVQEIQQAIKENRKGEQNQGQGQQKKDQDRQQDQDCQPELKEEKQEEKQAAQQEKKEEQQAAQQEKKEEQQAAQQEKKEQKAEEKEEKQATREEKKESQKGGKGNQN